MKNVIPGSMNPGCAPVLFGFRRTSESPSRPRHGSRLCCVKPFVWNEANVVGVEAQLATDIQHSVPLRAF